MKEKSAVDCDIYQVSEYCTIDKISRVEKTKEETSARCEKNSSSSESLSDYSLSDDSFDKTEECVSSRWYNGRSRYFFHFLIGIISCSLLSYVISEVEDSVIINWTELKLAKDKIDILWDRMTSNREAEPWIGLVEFIIRGFFLQTDETERLSYRNTFRPYLNKKKLLHTQGAHAKIKWKGIPNAFNYTGLLDEDDVDGIVTFSKGSRVLSNTSSSWGMGLKLLRDNGPPAATVLCSPSTLFGQVTSYNWNMFDAPLCSHVDIFLGAVLLHLARKRPKTGTTEERWTKYGNGPGLSNFADLTKFNETVANVSFPFAMCLRAPLSLIDKFAGFKAWYNPIELLKDVPPNTLLYEVLAFDTPQNLPDVFNAQRNFVKIAEIWTQSDFTTSRWADNHWTYQHQKFEDDLALRPEWKPFMTLKYLIMDGYGYQPLFKGRRGRKPNFHQIVSSFAPGLVGFIQILTNPAAAYQFLADDVGLQNLQQMAQSILLGLPKSPNPNSRSLESKVYGSLGLERFVEQLLKTAVFPGIPAYRSSRDNSEEKKFHMEEEVKDDAGEVFHWEEHMEKYGISNIKKKQTINFVENVAPYLEFDGHFLRPKNPRALQSLMHDPVMMEFTQTVLQQYTIQFGTDFMDDLTKAIFFGQEIGDLNSFARSILLVDENMVMGVGDGDATIGLSATARRSLNVGDSIFNKVLVKGKEKKNGSSFKNVIERLLVPMEKLGQVRI